MRSWATTASCVGDAGQDVFPLEPGIAREDGLDVVPRLEHPEHVLDRQTPAPHDRLPAEDLGVDGDTGEEVGVGHRARCQSAHACRAAPSCRCRPLCAGERWWSGAELNRRPQHFQCCALPAELPDHVRRRYGYHEVRPGAARFSARRRASRAGPEAEGGHVARGSGWIRASRRREGLLRRGSSGRARPRCARRRSRSRRPGRGPRGASAARRRRRSAWTPTFATAA